MVRRYTMDFGTEGVTFTRLVVHGYYFFVWPEVVQECLKGTRTLYFSQERDLFQGVWVSDESGKVFTLYNGSRYSLMEEGSMLVLDAFEQEQTIRAGDRK